MQNDSCCCEREREREKMAAPLGFLASLPPSFPPSFFPWREQKTPRVLSPADKEGRKEGNRESGQLKATNGRREGGGREVVRCCWIASHQLAGQWQCWIKNRAHQSGDILVSWIQPRQSFMNRPSNGNHDLSKTGNISVDLESWTDRIKPRNPKSQHEEV